MILNKKVAVIILSILMLFAGHSVNAASVAKNGLKAAPVKKDLPVTKVKKNPQVIPVHKDSQVPPDKKKPQVFPAKKKPQATSITKTPSSTPPKRPRLETQHKTSLKQTSLKGHCCINGIVQNKQTSNRECTSRKGSWYSSPAEAKKQCRLLSGYCIGKNNVLLPTSQKRCDQLSGTYFKSRAEAQIVVMKNRQESAGRPVTKTVLFGFCKSQDKIIPNITKTKCKHLKGTFYDKAHQARLAVAKEKQRKSRVMGQAGGQDSKPPRSAKFYLQETGKPVSAIATVSQESLLSGQGHKGTSSELYLPEKITTIHDPFFNLPKDGMFNPFVEDIRTPLLEGVDPGKIPGWGNRGGDPGRDHWAGRAERIWDDSNSGWIDYLYAAFLWLHVDNDIDQRSGIPRDGGSGGRGGSGINSGNSTGGTDDDDDDNDDNSDDGGDEQGDDQDSGDTGSEDENTDDDQEEDTDATEEDYQTGGDRGGRGGAGPSLGAQLSESMSIDLSTGRKKHERLTGGGGSGGHISTPVTQPGKGDEHQTDTPDIQTEPEDNTTPGEGIGPVVQYETPDPPGVGPNSQPSVDYEDDGPRRIMNNGNPIRLPDWVIDDPRVGN